MIVVNRFGSALLAISSGLIDVVGVGALKPRDVMREAVTTTTVSLSAVVSAAALASGLADAASWAKAPPARAPKTSAEAVQI